MGVYIQTLSEYDCYPVLATEIIKTATNAWIQHCARYVTSAINYFLQICSQSGVDHIIGSSPTGSYGNEILVPILLCSLHCAFQWMQLT
jgi:hypothetical protein